MTIYDLVKSALLQRKAMVIVRKGSDRYVCPHVIGIKIDKKTGRRKQSCLFYQWDGASETGLGPDGSDLNWRCVPIEQIEDAKIIDGERWHTVEVLPTKVSFCVDEVDAKVWL